MHAMGITQEQFEKMKRRLRHPPRQAEPVLPMTAAGAPGVAHQIVLGIDPSLRGTGFGVVRRGGSGPGLLAQGTIVCPVNWGRSRCLLKILETLREVIRGHAPTVAVVEGLFYAQNLQTSLIMGEARGACLVAVAEGGLEVFELAPRKVKQAIVGYGGAQKLAVARMVQRMLKLTATPEPDAADALALALAFLQESARFSLAPMKRI
jgi:crossover junction endodeoxyribonuclease RuvC